MGRRELSRFGQFQHSPAFPPHKSLLVGPQPRCCPTQPHQTPAGTPGALTHTHSHTTLTWKSRAGGLPSMSAVTRVATGCFCLRRSQLGASATTPPPWPEPVGPLPDSMADRIEASILHPLTVQTALWGLLGFHAFGKRDSSTSSIRRATRQPHCVHNVYSHFAMFHFTWLRFFSRKLRNLLFFAWCFASFLIYPLSPSIFSRAVSTTITFWACMSPPHVVGI